MAYWPTCAALDMKSRKIIILQAGGQPFSTLSFCSCRYFLELQNPFVAIECRPNLDYHGRMKSESLLEYVLRNLDENKGRHAEIATATGVPYSTLAKIYQGVTPNPGVQSIQALADYFRAAKC